MIPTQTQTQFPVFANNGTKLEPDASKYTNGFVEGDVFPYQWENWLMNKASDAITKHNAGLDSIEKELNSILTEAGKTADNTKFNQVLESIVAIITTKISKNIEISDADGSHTGAQVSFNQNGTVTLYLPSEIKATIEGGITSADDSLKFGGETPAQFKATLSGVTTYTSSTTVVPEYDRRYVLNGNGITLTLSSATVTGTRAEVYAQQAANVVHDSTITDALLAGERAIYAWNGTSWDYVGGVPLGQLNYTAHCDTALGTAKALAIPGFTLRNGTTIKVLFDNGYYSSSSGQVMTLNVNALGAKNIYVCKNGSKELLDSHYLLRTEGGISTEQYWFIMSNTMLELMYDATLDSNNGGWLVLGNPVVLSSTDYTIYADGQIRYADENKLSDWEDITISTDSNHPTEMSFDGFYVFTGRGDSTQAWKGIQVFINNEQISYQATSYGCVSTSVPFKKGDKIYILKSGVMSPTWEKVCYYKNRDYSNR